MVQIFPFLIFFILIISSTVLLQKWTKSSVATLILAPILSSVLYQVIGYIVQGYLDSFFLIAVIFSYVMGVVICLVVLFTIGILSRSMKKENR